MLPLWLPVSLLAVAACALLACSSGGFLLPTAEVRESAIGFTGNLSLTQRSAYHPHPRSFRPIRKPGRHDWLATHAEPGQTYQEFLASRPLTPGGRRRVIYLQPIGDLESKTAPPLERVKSYVEAFFPGLPVRVAKPMSIESVAEHSQTRPRRDGAQLFTRQIEYVLKKRLPKDAFCVLGITMEDLYSDSKSGFTFGHASLYGRVGVVSFARFHPAFYKESAPPEATSKALERSCKVLVHETSHTFGLRHCIHYECIMNGYRYLREVDSKPLQLCPVCLRKLHSSLGFDIVNRYQGLQSWYLANGFESDRLWTAEHLRRFESHVPDDPSSGSH